jgi:hypothetical protein
MRVFLGMILGSALTILTVFAIDSMNATATTASGAPATIETRQMVNWDVVGARTRGLREELKQFVAQVQTGWHRLTG